MSDYNILVVGTDPSVVGLLNIHLEEQGYSVFISDNVPDSLSYLERKKFDLIILDTSELGSELYTEVKNNPETREIPFILLNAWGSETSFELGPRDHVADDMDMEGLIDKVRDLLQVSQEPEKQSPLKSAKVPKGEKVPYSSVTVEDGVVFKGYPDKIGIQEIMRGLSLMGKSGRLWVTYGNRKGYLYFVQGNVTHAVAGNLKGEKAIYRLLLWSNGQFLFDPKTILLEQNVRTPVETLFMECSRRLEQYKSILRQLPPLETHVEPLSLGHLKTFSPSEMKLLSIVNRQPTILQLIESSSLEDLVTLEAISRFYRRKIIGPVEEEEEDADKGSASPEYRASLEGNLTEINIGEIIQILVLIRKDGRLFVVWEDRKGEIYLQNGNITYATVEDLKGESAIYRLLAWREGKFRFDTGITTKNRNVQKSLESIFFEGLDILEEYRRLMEQFPSLNAYVEVISVTGHENITPEEAKILKVVNESDTLNDIISHSPFDDLKTLKILSRLYLDRIIGVSKGAPGKKSQQVNYDQLADDLFG
jgi:CheY-like chemotaxis protein